MIVNLERSPRVYGFLLAIVLFSFAPGCRQKPAAEEQGGESGLDAHHPVEAVADDAGGGGPHDGLQINGTRISRENIEAIAAPYLAQVEKHGGRQPALAIQQRKRDVFAKVVRKIIIEELLGQEARRRSISASVEEADAQIESLAHELEPPLTMEQFVATAAATGKALEELREEARRGVIFNKLLDLALADRVGVTEAEAKRYYDNTPDEFVIPENILVSHILITPAPGEDPNRARQEARERIEGLLDEIKAGADIADLASLHSSCDSRSRGGNLGYITKGLRAPAFEAAAFALEANEVSEVVEASYGFHIIKVFEHNPAGVFAFEDVRDKVIKQLEAEKRLEATRQYIDQLQAAAEIKDNTAWGKDVGF